MKFAMGLITFAWKLSLRSPGLGLQTTAQALHHSRNRGEPLVGKVGGKCFADTRRQPEQP